MVFTVFSCFDTKSQRRVPKNAQTNDPDAPIKVRISTKITSIQIESYTGMIYKDIAVIA